MAETPSPRRDASNSDPGIAVQPFEGPTFFAMPTPAPGLFHDLRQAHFVLQGRELATQAQ